MKGEKVKIPFMSHNTEEFMGQSVLEEALTDQELAAVTGGYYDDYDDDYDDDCDDDWDY